MAQFVLQLHEITKKIGSKTIIHDISFDIEPGEVFGLLGPNGAGKTTIIRSIVGLINRSSGKVIINGKDIDNHFKEAIANIGAIIENPEFYLYMSGLDNLKQFARMSRKEISAARIDEVIEQVKLTNAIHQKVKTYSLGMRQRLGVAQALLHNPTLLILDEPTNGLDPQGMAEFRELIRLLANQGTSVLISSHLLSEIQQITDRFAIIEKGKLTHIQTISDLENTAQMLYRIRVSDVNAAKQALLALNLNITDSQEDMLEFEIEKEQIAQVAKALVANHIDLLELVRQQASLEERFLQLTNRGEE
ncbi:ABC transporter ATP-binding protein [Listeria sp. PSOL-1]|uniref:ABC transporter ATP-binding protein n=1 Tax=Listeria sp. PSOL-1 TaxID=1844999 RepID=UPI0013D2E147|nr:ABC transporter ATP-binding protein [Listeria sp. PSOL-1]